MLLVVKRALSKEVDLDPTHLMNAAVATTVTADKTGNMFHGARDSTPVTSYLTLLDLGTR